MIEMPIPKDIMKYESKLVGPFTARQTLTGVCCIIIAAVWFAAAFRSMSHDVWACLLAVFCTPVLIFNFKPYGIPMEKFLGSVFVSMFLSKPQKVYRTGNRFAVLTQSYEKEYIAKNTKNKSTKKPKKKRKESVSLTAYR